MSDDEAGGSSRRAARRATSWRWSGSSRRGSASIDRMSCWKRASRAGLDRARHQVEEPGAGACQPASSPGDGLAEVMTPATASRSGRVEPPPPFGRVGLGSAFMMVTRTVGISQSSGRQWRSRPVARSKRSSSRRRKAEAGFARGRRRRRAEGRRVRGSSRRRRAGATPRPVRPCRGCDRSSSPGRRSESPLRHQRSAAALPRLTSGPSSS